MKKSILLLGLVCLLAVSYQASGCGRHSGKEGEDETVVRKVHLKKELQDSVGLTTALAESKKLVSFIEAYGSIAQDTENTVHLTAKEPGILKSFKITEGDTVEEGSPLAVIETNEGKEVEIASPSHGIVMSRYVKAGDRVDSLTSLATISDPDLLRAGFDIYEKDLSFVSLGQKVRVTSTAYPDKEFQGKVVFISPRVDETTRTIKVRVDVENKEHLLKFGMFVTGEIEKVAAEESLIVPLESLQPLEGGFVVFAALDEESFEVRNVRPGKKTELEAEVLEGLRPGEKVVAHGSFTLKSELLKETLGGEE